MRKSKRGLLSLLLTLAMVLTMLPTTALAVDVAPVDTAPTDTAAAPAEPETAPAPKETPEEPAPDADVDANADEPAEAPEKPAETPEAPAEDTDAPAGDEAPAPEETTPPADADTGADAEAPEAPEEPAGQPEETPAPEEEPKDEEPDGVTAPAADKVLDSGPVPVLEEGTITFEEILTFENSDLPDSEELFAGYVDKTLYGGDMELFGTAAGDRLAANEKAVYNALKPIVKSIADGTRTATQGISIPLAEKTWQRSEIGLAGVPLVDSNNHLTSEAGKKLNAALATYCDMGAVMDALLADLPYDMYWFDKTIGMATSYGVSYSPTTITLKQFQLSFVVACEFAPGGVRGGYATDASKTSLPKTAAQNAAAIVAKHQDKSDYDKLRAYRDEICDLVDYNYDALKPGTLYGNPWQLIWVFDKNPATKVVCEGYAKAFQYLFDLSSFTEDITCYIVTGDMGSDGSVSAGDGPHMWNVVKMEDGKNYLVDITNCDVGTGGAYRDMLFLVGAPTSDPQKYVLPFGGDTISYLYDEEERGRYTDEDGGFLRLAETNYTVPNATPLTITDATLAEKVFDGFKEGAVTGVTFANAEDGSPVELKLGSDYTAVVTYANENAGTKSATVTVSLTNRNYSLANKTYSIASAEIKKATATAEIALTTNQQKVGKAVGVVVSALNPNSDFVVGQPKTVVMDTPAGITLNRIEDDSVIFTGVYNIPLDATIGDMNFTVKITDPNFVEASATAVLKVVDKGPVNVTLTADKTENVTYGDSVTFTAKAAKANADDTDTLAGKLTLSLGGKVLGETEDLTKDITVTLDKADLKAGTHTLKADFVSSNNFFGNSSNTLEVTVAKKTLTWDTSLVTLNVKQNATAETVANALKGQNDVKVTGALEGETVGVTVEGLKLPVDFTLDTATPGEKTPVALDYTKAELTGADAANYQLPAEKPTVVPVVTEVKVLEDKEEDKDKYVTTETELAEDEAIAIEVEDGITEIPDAIKDKGLDTPGKLVEKLRTEVKKVLTNMEDDNFAAYEVALKYTTDGGKTWNTATDNKYFPITVILPYPEGTDSSYDFKVVHMFTTPEKAGEVETPQVLAKTAKGIKFTVTSLSPISVGWTKASYSGGGSGGGGGGNYSGDIWEKIEKKIEEADKGDRIEAKVTDENMPISTMQALYDDGGVTLVIKWNGEEIIIPAGKALNPSTEAGRIYYPLSYLAEIYKGSKIPSNAGNPETGGVWVVTAPVYTDPAPAPTEPVPVPEAVEPTPEPEAPKAPETPTATAPVQPEEPVNSSSKVGTIVALLALMAAAAAGAYFLYKKRDDDGLYTK